MAGGSPSPGIFTGPTVPRRRCGGDLYEQLVGVLVPGDAGEDPPRVSRGCRGAAMGGAELGPAPGALGKGWGGTAPPARGGPSPPGGTRGG